MILMRYLIGPMWLSIGILYYFTQDGILFPIVAILAGISHSIESYHTWKVSRGKNKQKLSRGEIDGHR